MKYYVYESGNLKEIKDSKSLKPTDKVIVSNLTVKREFKCPEIDNLPVGRILSAKTGEHKALMFGIPFAANACDIDITFDYQDDTITMYDYGYQFAKKRLLTIGAKDWAEDKFKITEGSESDRRKFIRKWNEQPIVEEDGFTYPEEPANIDLVILTHNNEATIFDQLRRYEPLFKRVVILDDYSTDKTELKVKEYVDLISEEDGFTPDVIFIKRELDGDFGAQRNAGTKECKSEWVFHLDADEDLDDTMFEGLHRVAVTCNIQKRVGAIFGRINFLDGVIVNDIPRERWTTAYLKSIKGTKEEPTKVEHEMDWQCRLHKRHIKWVRKVHEMIEPMFNAFRGQKSEANKCLMVADMFLIHKKTVTKQRSQDTFYEDLLDEDKNIFFDSVMFKHEGITKHAREEAKQLNNMGWNIFLSDLYSDGFGEEFKEMYKPFDMKCGRYITYINQPPLRPSRTHDLYSRLGFPNIVYFLAWEGDILPPPWKEVMSHPTVRKILTPSKYCKDVFEEAGLKNVEVVPHGIDSELYKPTSPNWSISPVKPDNKKAFLFVGTWHGIKKDRKGIDIILKAWNAVQSDLPDWKLVLKLNSIYFESEHWAHSLRNVIGATPRIEVIDSNMTEEEMAQIYNSCHVFVNPSRAEGFSIPSLEAAACGLPVIATDATGHVDFLRGHAKMIKVLRKIPAEERYPYKGEGWHANWVEPSGEHLQELMKELARDYVSLRDAALKRSETIRKEYSWGVIAQKMDKIFKEII